MKYIIIKFGGSLITDKTIPYKFNQSITENLVQQVKLFLNEFNKEYRIIIVHGSGSFGHTDAIKYNVGNGFEKDSFGACKTHYSAQYLNQLVSQIFIEQKLSSISLNPSSFIFNDKDNKIQAEWQILDFINDKNILPIFYGDIIFDKNKGCQILSGEKIINLITNYLLSKNQTISQIIHLGIENGVYDKTKEVIPLINADNIDTIQFDQNNKIDSTGGMKHKVLESYYLAEKGIDVSIVNGLVENSLYKAMTREMYYGTIIKK